MEKGRREVEVGGERRDRVAIGGWWVVVVKLEVGGAALYAIMYIL